MNPNCDEMQDLISVIVPVYNVEQYLETCIESVLQQTYPCLEILLIDDGSTDRSGDICDRYGAIDARVQVIHQHNSGLSSARNCGLRHARGKYICFVDSDDILHKQFLETALSLLHTCQVSMVKAKCQFFQEDRDLHFDTLDIETTPRQIVTGREELLRSYEPTRKIGTAVWAALYARSLLENLWFEAGRLHEDFMYSYEVLCRAEHFLSINAVAYGYRQHKDSICHSTRYYGKRQYDFLYVRVLGIKYLEKHLPDLVEPAIADLISESMLMQCWVWKQEPGEDVERVQNLIKKIRRTYKPSLNLLRSPEISRRRKISLLAARLSFVAACRCKYALMR